MWIAGGNTACVRSGHHYVVGARRKWIRQSQCVRRFAVPCEDNISVSISDGYAKRTRSGNPRDGRCRIAGTAGERSRNNRLRRHINIDRNDFNVLLAGVVGHSKRHNELADGRIGRCGCDPCVLCVKRIPVVVKIPLIKRDLGVPRYQRMGRKCGLEVYKLVHTRWVGRSGNDRDRLAHKELGRPDVNAEYAVVVTLHLPRTLNLIEIIDEAGDGHTCFVAV